MITIKTATQLYNTITAFNYDKTDEISEWFVQGCKFSLSHGQLGHNHPTIGWYCAVDFKHDVKPDAIDSIQWVLDEYGNNYTFLVLDVDAYNEEVGLDGLVKTEEIFGLLIGCSSFKEPVEELRDRGIIKILAIEPRQ